MTRTTVRPGAIDATDRGKQWIGVDELAAELGIPVRTIYAWRSMGKGPRAARFGKHLRFARVDVDAWTEQQKDEPRVGAA